MPCSTRNFLCSLVLTGLCVADARQFLSNVSYNVARFDAEEAVHTTISPNGSWVAVGGEDGVHIYSRPLMTANDTTNTNHTDVNFFLTTTIGRTVAGQCGDDRTRDCRKPYSVNFSPNGKYLATGHSARYHHVMIHNVSAIGIGQGIGRSLNVTLKTLDDRQRMIKNVQVLFSSDSKWLAVSYREDGCSCTCGLYLVDQLVKGENNQTYPHPFNIARIPGDETCTIAFSNDARWLAVGSDIESKTQLYSLDSEGCDDDSDSMFLGKKSGCTASGPHPRATPEATSMSSMAFSHDDKMLAIGTKGNGVKLYKFHFLDGSLTYSGEKSILGAPDVQSVVWSPNSSWLVVTTTPVSNQSVQVFKVGATSSAAAIVPISNDWNHNIDMGCTGLSVHPASVSFSSGSSWMVISSCDGNTTVHSWDPPCPARACYRPLPAVAIDFQFIFMIAGVCLAVGSSMFTVAALVWRWRRRKTVDARLDALMVFHNDVLQNAYNDAMAQGTPSMRSYAGQSGGGSLASFRDSTGCSTSATAPTSFSH